MPGFNREINEVYMLKIRVVDFGGKHDGLNWVCRSASDPSKSQHRRLWELRFVSANVSAVSDRAPCRGALQCIPSRRRCGSSTCPLRVFQLPAPSYHPCRSCLCRTPVLKLYNLWLKRQIGSIMVAARRSLRVTPSDNIPRSRPSQLVLVLGYTPLINRRPCEGLVSSPMDDRMRGTS